MEQIMKGFHVPRWEEIPDIGLYLDQTLTILQNYLEPYIGYKDERIITKTMINNYVKQQVLPPPEKKRYSREHLAMLFVICVLKQVYSISDIRELIRLALSNSPREKMYNSFCDELEVALQASFSRETALFDGGISENRYILKKAVQSFADKFYVEKMFLYK